MHLLYQTRLKATGKGRVREQKHRSRQYSRPAEVVDRLDQLGHQAQLLKGRHAASPLCIKRVPAIPSRLSLRDGLLLLLLRWLMNASLS